MITMLQEITDWKDVPIANGIYHLNDAGHLVGYEGPKTEYKKFKKPMKGFAKTRRKFVQVGTYEDQDENDGLTRIKFTGSKGNTYVVTVQDDNVQCTCPGFKFRGYCKHHDEIAEKIKAGITI